MAVPQIDTEYEKEIKKAEEKLKNLISSEFRAADLLRLAYASQFSIFNSRDDNAGTSADATDTKATQSANNNNLKTETGSTTFGDATITNTTPSANNKKLKTAIEKIKESHPIITSPDLYQLAGTVAIEELGGPIIQFVPGRKDSSISPDEGCLPDVKKSPTDLKDVFRKVRISDPKHIVALCGGLNLARSQDPNLKLDNSYFVDLDQKKSSSPAGSNPLLDDEYFYSSVYIYAKNKEAFIKDYEEAHKKLSELGLPDSSFIRSALAKSTSLVNNPVGQKEKVVGVAVAAIVVILSIFYLINRRRAKPSSQQFH